MSDNDFSGVITALVTPFKKGEVDFDSLKKLLRRQLEDGVHGVVVNGTTAESPTLTKEEVKKIFEFVRGEIAGQVPVIVGTGSNSTAATAAFSREVAGWGADALLVVVPYYNKPPQRGLIAHFQEVAKAAGGKPVILYNVPSRTVAGFEPETIGQLAKTSNIVGIKEATGNMDLLAKIRAQVDDEFLLLSGDDGTFVDFCSRGGHGTISVSSHVIAKDMTHFMDRAHEGDKTADQEYKSKYAEFMKYLYIEANPIPVKMVLHWMGILSSPEMRLPLVQLDEKFHKDFKACLKNLNLL